MTVTSTTADNLLFDAGVLYKNYGLAGELILGATADANSFTIEREFYEVPANGVKGKTKGLKRLVVENATLSVNLLELSMANLKLALSGSTEDTSNLAYNELRSSGKIVVADFIDNIALVTTDAKTGSPVVIILENALSDGGFSVTFTDKQEARLPVQFSAHYAPDATGVIKAPFAIRRPK